MERGWQGCCRVAHAPSSSQLSESISISRQIRDLAADEQCQVGLLNNLRTNSTYSTIHGLINLPYLVFKRYIEEFNYTKSEKGKTPWITVNGVNVADSQFAIDYLKRELGVDNNSNFSNKDKGKLSTAVMMTPCLT